MTTEKAIKMIDEYLLEPNSIAKEWVEVLLLCKKALEKQIPQKAALGIVIKRSLSGVLPCHMVDRIAERVANALVVEGVSVKGCAER